jgi:hypothetical protein
MPTRHLFERRYGIIRSARPQENKAIVAAFLALDLILGPSSQRMPKGQRYPRRSRAPRSDARGGSGKPNSTDGVARLNAVRALLREHPDTSTDEPARCMNRKWRP